MKELAVLNKYFWKYRYRFGLGVIFIILSNYFAIQVPEFTGFIINKIQEMLPGGKPIAHAAKQRDWFVNMMIRWMEHYPAAKVISMSCIMIFVVSLVSGVCMFLMRQTIIVMSRYIEYDQKNEVYAQYQRLDSAFYKTHSTGDLMNRMSEDISRVRMYYGPAIMYSINVVLRIALCLSNMLRKDTYLTMLTLLPLPILTITIYFVNLKINKQSKMVQSRLSDLTTNAQESYSGIRVIKSFVQESAMLNFFKENSETYRKNAVGLAKVNAVFQPAMMFIIGLSTLFTVYVGSKMALADTSKIGLIVEFVIYINLLTFPVSSIGFIAGMVQRAIASQSRLNEFLKEKPSIVSPAQPLPTEVAGDIVFDHVSLTYANTGIHALNDFDLHIKKGDKVMILGKTGSGKSTVAQLLLRFYDPTEGRVMMDGADLKLLDLQKVRDQISYTPQDVFLFSDTIANNIRFGLDREVSLEEVKKAAQFAFVDQEIEKLPEGYDTLVGERGVTLSGGQKQRISIARALIKNPQVAVFDDILSAVDNKTEHAILSNLDKYMRDKTAILITHRIFATIHFDQIIVMKDGHIEESGTHEQLMQRNGHYAEMYASQLQEDAS